MRLWAQQLIHLLPRQQLLGQHRECAALRGMGWGRKHATVDYVFKHDPAFLVAYHYCIIAEMERRGYYPDRVWAIPDWRGSVLGEETDWADKKSLDNLWMNVNQMGSIIYPEHDKAYLRECIENLRGKGIDVSEMEKLL